MIKIGYRRYGYDCCMYVRSLDDDSFIFLLLYVDDMLIAAKSVVEVNKLKVLLSREFDMKDLGTGKKILGMEIRKRCQEIVAISSWLCEEGAREV